MDFGQNQNMSNELEALEANRKYITDAFHREKSQIEEEHEKLNKAWDEKFERLKNTGYSSPLMKMHYDGTMDQHNKKIDELQERSKNNRKMLDEML